MSSPSSQASAHQILGLRLGASKDDIKRRYRQLCMKWHPDMVEPTRRDEAEQMFKRITEAFSCLQENEEPQKQTQTAAKPNTYQGPSGGQGPFEGRRSPFPESNSSSSSQSFTDPYNFSYKYYGKGRKPFEFRANSSGDFQSMSGGPKMQQSGSRTRRNMQYDFAGWKPKNYHERYNSYYKYTGSMSMARETTEANIKFKKFYGVPFFVFAFSPLVAYIGWCVMTNEGGMFETQLNFLEGEDLANPFPNRRPIW
eukprot:TRINITY_DN3418_c0_g1_i1.p1 TRINITY_DN3418_c0_g1~~TRINITY_DN3418_c0_g1_i1.p1  ORF type:complete len:254 (-),score=13.99 TRINITY_DN3418_c0_g1_i1:371-1132(-)